MLLALFVVLLLAVLYWFPLRRWFSRWGTTRDELTRAMAGDAFINPTHSDTEALTIDAPPEDIWPWLVQLGYQRGGLYSYDWLDRLFGFLDRPSTNRVLPEFQHLAVGDRIFFGPHVELTVKALEPSCALVLYNKAFGYEWVWQFGLYPIDENCTRLVSRGTERIPKTVSGWLFRHILEPTGFIMTRRMLLGVKQRAETRRAQTLARAA